MTASSRTPDGASARVSWLMDLAGAVKDGVSIAAEIGAAVKLVRRGRRLMALCPFHGEKTPSFTVDDAKGRFHCFGCGASGDVIAFVQMAESLDFKEAVLGLASRHGLSRGTHETAAEREARLAAFRARQSEKRREAEAEEERRRQWRRADAASIFRAARHDAAALTPYLEGRGIDLAAIARGWGESAPRGVPLSLLFLADCPDELNDRTDPAMVTPMRDAERRFGGVHRTFLTRDLSAKRAFDAKTTRGAMVGHFILLAPAAETMIMGEGIETTLSVMAGLGAAGRSAGVGAMAGISLGNITGRRFGPIPDMTDTRAIHLPAVTRHLILLEDQDMKDKRAGEEAFTAAARRFGRAGVSVVRARPGEGLDFNDLLRRGEAPSGVRGKDTVAA